MPIFYVLWVGLVILGFLYFQLDGDAERKERFHPPFVIGVGIVFLVTMAVSGAADMLFVAIPFVALLGWLTIRNTRFCHACGRTNRTAQWSRPRYCSACGSALDRA